MDICRGNEFRDTVNPLLEQHYSKVRGNSNCLLFHPNCTTSINQGLYSLSHLQFEQQFLPKSLCNWEVPRCQHLQQPAIRPRARRNVTRIIANDRGHLLPGVGRGGGGAGHGQAKQKPWGTFRSTWQLPDKIVTRKEAFELNGIALQTPFTGPRWVRRATTGKNKQEQTKLKVSTKLSLPKCANHDLQYVPGDLTEPCQQHSSRVELIEELRKEEQDVGEAELAEKVNDLYLEKHKCQDEIGQLEEAQRKENSARNELHVLGEEFTANNDQDTMMRYFVPDKPTEKETYAPIIPAYCNFETAKKMAQENLEHQPLPDAVMDRAYRQVSVV